MNQFWDLDQGKLHEFSGGYDDYHREKLVKRSAIEAEIEKLSRAKKDIHQSLMKEQQRASKSKAKGEKSIKQRKWPTIVSEAKMGRSQESSGRKQAAISDKKSDLMQQLKDLRLPEIILPTFSLQAADLGSSNILSISEGIVHGIASGLCQVFLGCHPQNTDTQPPSSQPDEPAKHYEPLEAAEDLRKRCSS